MKKLAAFFVLALLTSVGVIGYSIFEELRKAANDDPTVWEQDIQALAAATREAAPPENAILFVGSSSIRLWSSLAEDMAPAPVIQHGFGGSKIEDVNFYAEQLITQWQAPKVVIFVGSNNINGNEEHATAPIQIRDQLALLLDTILAARADTQIFYISITPTLFSWDKWASVQEANRLAAELCDSYENAHFIETADLFLDEQGEPNKTLYAFDGLHLSAEGYAAWTDRIKPRLM